MAVRALALALAFMSAFAIPCLPCAHAAAAPAQLDPNEAQAIAADAYLYAYPLLVMDTARRVQTNTTVPDNDMGAGAPLNQFSHMSRASDALLHGVAYPDVDALTSSLWFDVSKEPLLIDVPEAGNRYYLMSLADMWTDVFAAPGTRTTGGEHHVFAIAAADWHGTLPKNVELLRATTPAGRLLLRIRLNGTADLPAARTLQSGFTATPLSRWGKKYQPPPGTFDVAMSRQTAADQVATLSAADFLAAFSDLAGKYPPHANDTPMLQRLLRLGLVPGQRFDLARAPAGIRAAIEAGVQNAQARVRSPAEPRAGGSGGWPTPRKPRGTYGTDYALRARLARTDLVSHLSEDLIHIRAGTDAEGRPLDGTFRYEVRFERAQLPPVDAFWSLTLYNDRCELADNQVNRYAAGTRDALTTAPDGSTTIYVQYAAPVTEKVRNWLPGPQSGHFSLDLRLYWPRDAAVEGAWAPPSIRRVQ